MGKVDASTQRLEQKASRVAFPLDASTVSLINSSAPSNKKCLPITLSFFSVISISIFNVYTFDQVLSPSETSGRAAKSKTDNTSSSMRVQREKINFSSIICTKSKFYARFCLRGARKSQELLKNEEKFRMKRPVRATINNQTIMPDSQQQKHIGEEAKKMGVGVSDSRVGLTHFLPRSFLLFSPSFSCFFFAPQHSCFDSVSKPIQYRKRKDTLVTKLQRGRGARAIAANLHGPGRHMPRDKKTKVSSRIDLKIAYELYNNNNKNKTRFKMLGDEARGHDNVVQTNYNVALLFTRCTATNLERHFSASRLFIESCFSVTFLLNSPRTTHPTRAISKNTIVSFYDLRNTK